MWYTWIVLLLVSCALVRAEVEEAAGSVAEVTTRATLLTLDRKAAELAWSSWLQGPENGNQNATHRRITTKSLFVTPLRCREGQQAHNDGCVQIVTVNKDEHERNLLNSLNKHYTLAPNNGNEFYDYGEEQGPYQLSIPIGLDPLAGAPLDLTAQGQNPQPTYVQVDKKGDTVSNAGASIEAELELLKLQTTTKLNRTDQPGSHTVSHNFLNNLLTYSDKPKRDSPLINDTETETSNNTDKGQEEMIFGNVNVDPMVYGTQNENEKEMSLTLNNNETSILEGNDKLSTSKINEPTSEKENIDIKVVPNTTMQSLKAAPEQTKLNPENEYSDIGEAIKLISRYADVSTDDNFTKEKNNGHHDPTDDSILGTRTKLQYRRNKPKLSDNIRESPIKTSEYKAENKPTDINLSGADKYPWPNVSPPPNYPFRHVQDYWSGLDRLGGVYNSMHENPRRHHHSYPHYFRPRAYINTDYTESQSMQQPYPRLRRYQHKIGERNNIPIRSQGSDQDLYSLLGLRHWFSSEGASKR